jgi:hypothetical protein
LRRGVAAFGCKKQVLYGAALHQSIQTTGRDGRRFRNSANPHCAFSGDCRAAGYGSCESLYPSIAASSGTWG